MNMRLTRDRIDEVFDLFGCDAKSYTEQARPWASCVCALFLKRGIVAQRLERKTLIHEVVGSNPAVVTSSVLPKGGGWMTVQRHRPANRFQLSRTCTWGSSTEPTIA